jgi:hypothetical protein
VVLPGSGLCDWVDSGGGNGYNRCRLWAASLLLSHLSGHIPVLICGAHAFNMSQKFKTLVR